MSNNRNRRRNNAPSAAELARREAQANGGILDSAEVKYLGVRIPVKRVAFQDVEVMEALAAMDDDSVSEADKIRYATKASRMIAGDKWDHLLAAVRHENDGYAPLSDILRFVRLASEALGGPGRSAS